MVERGDATAEDVDQAMKLGAGYREFITLEIQPTLTDYSYGSESWNAEQGFQLSTYSSLSRY
jgi:hypothetical protein